jgi:hypothetical protein
MMHMQSVDRETVSHSNLERYSYIFDLFDLHAPFLSHVKELYMRDTMKSKWSLHKVIVCMVFFLISIFTVFFLTDSLCCISKFTMQFADCCI